MRTAHEGLIGQILTMNVLRIQAVWSHHRLRRHNKLLNFLLHRQLRLISLISSQRRMLHNWPAQPEGLQALLERLLAELGQPGCDKYRIARLLAPLVPTAARDYRLHTFWRRLRHFCWGYLECQRWLDRLAVTTIGSGRHRRATLRSPATPTRWRRPTTAGAPSSACCWAAPSGSTASGMRAARR